MTVYSKKRLERRPSHPGAILKRIWARRIGLLTVRLCRCFGCGQSKKNKEEHHADEA
jgi:hypothetical protein